MQLQHVLDATPTRGRVVGDGQGVQQMVGEVLQFPRHAVQRRDARDVRL